MFYGPPKNKVSERTCIPSTSNVAKNETNHRSRTENVERPRRRIRSDATCAPSFSRAPRATCGCHPSPTSENTDGTNPRVFCPSNPTWKGSR
eukprot:scaffold56_cov390-Pavlova_lutheri.AAC.10